MSTGSRNCWSRSAHRKHFATRLSNRLANRLTRTSWTPFLNCNRLRPGPGVPLPHPVPVTESTRSGRDLPVPRTAHLLDVRVHHLLREPPDHLTQQIRARRCQGLLELHARNRHNIPYCHFALLRLELGNSKDGEVAALPSRQHAVLRQSSHIRIGYPIHHFRDVGDNSPGCNRPSCKRKVGSTTLPLTTTRSDYVTADRATGTEQRKRGRAGVGST